LTGLLKFFNGEGAATSGVINMGRGVMIVSRRQDRKRLLEASEEERGTE